MLRQGGHVDFVVIAYSIHRLAIHRAHSPSDQGHRPPMLDDFRCQPHRRVQRDRFQIRDIQRPRDTAEKIPVALPLDWAEGRGGAHVEDDSCSAAVHDAVEVGVEGGDVEFPFDFAVWPCVDKADVLHELEVVAVVLLLFHDAEVEVEHVLHGLEGGLPLR